jgi:hypothetical protein
VRTGSLAISCFGSTKAKRSFGLALRALRTASDRSTSVRAAALVILTGSAAQGAEADRTVFAMVNARRSYNANGARGWEWFELKNGARRRGQHTSGAGSVLLPAKNMAATRTAAATSVTARAASTTSFKIQDSRSRTYESANDDEEMLCARRGHPRPNLVDFAAANPRPLPFTYYDANDGRKAKARSNNTPTSCRYRRDAPPTETRSRSSRVSSRRSFEYGITDRLELGLYFVIVPHPGDAFTQVPGLTQGNGLKQTLAVSSRRRRRMADRRRAFTAKSPSSRTRSSSRADHPHAGRFGDLRIATNLWAEYEAYLTKGRVRSSSIRPLVQPIR